ncbi:MAG: ABC transporter permease [Anaerolineae bacterium]|jgi:ABC-2 type transport system permease protein|nr:ABC transporter permease [Anaerolineae bacterium]
MNRRHVLAIAKKEWLHIIRDPISIFLLMIGPVLMLIIISYAMATDVENVPVMVYDQDGSPESDELVKRLDRHNVLDVITHVDSTAEVEDKLKRREARVAVLIEEGFADQLSSIAGLQSLYTDGPRVSFIIDGTDPISAETAMETALQVSEAYMTERLNVMLDEQSEAGADETLIEVFREQLTTPITLEIDNRYNPDLKAIWDLVPAMIAVALMLPGMSISTTIAREHSQGTLESLVATPVDKEAILLGKALPYVLISLINVILMYIVARVIFGVPFRGNLALYLALSALYAFATLAVGLLFSILIRNVEAALWASMMFFLFPGMFLSGMFFPVEIFPFVIKIETLELPATSGVVINRGMFLQGVSARVLWWNILLLLIIAVEGFEIAVRLFKKRIA